MADTLKLLAARVPPSLIDQAQRHAALYHTSVSQLLREALEYRLACTAWPPNGTVAPLPSAVHAMLAHLAHTLTQAAEELLTMVERDADGSPLEALLPSDERTMEEDEVYDSITLAELAADDPPVGHDVPEEAAMSNCLTLAEHTETEVSNSITSPPEATAAGARPEKAALVSRVRALRAAGLSLARIAAGLQAEGVPTLSGKGVWQKGTIDNLLRGR